MTRLEYSGKVIEVMKYAKITSAANQRVRDAVRTREKRVRSGHNAFLLEGPHLVEMALSAGVRIREVFVTGALISQKEHQDLMGRVLKTTDLIFEVSDQVLNKISSTETPQGMAAVADYGPGSLSELSFHTNPLVVVVDTIQDPGNLGTIIRTADAAGADAVIVLPGSCDVFMPKVIRATAGSIFNIPVVNADPEALLTLLRANRIRLAVTAAGAETSLYDTDLSGPVAVAFGNEARGVSSKLKKAADFSLSIPIFGRAESLNAATSAAICLYEIVRQRGSSTIG
jgi:TrmH family RNA methyltransferase